jgi:hypothetical protein
VATMRSKTTIYLDSRQAKLLALIAADRGTTQAELIRQAIDQLIESTVLPLPDWVGMGASTGPHTPIDMREERKRWGEHLDRKYSRPGHAESA